MDKNIFEAMGKKKGPEKQAKQGPLIGPNKPKVPPLPDEKEQNELLQRMKGMRYTLEKQIDEVYSRGKEVKLTKELLPEDPSQLPPEQQAELRRRDKELREKVKLMDISIKGDMGSLTDHPEAAKGKRGKFRAARNKWIPMK